MSRELASPHCHRVPPSAGPGAHARATRTIARRRTGCRLFEAFHKLKHTEGMAPSNYWVRSNSETCFGCGLCVKRCPMEALHLENFPEAEGRTTVVEAASEGKTKELKNKSGKVSAVILICVSAAACVLTNAPRNRWCWNNGRSSTARRRMDVNT